MTPEIEQFAKTLIEFVRDASVQSNDRELRPTAQSRVAKRWRLAADGDSLSFARVMIPDVVDETIFYLLQAIDEGLLKMQFTTSE
jgi:hypothetical protein